MSSNTVGTRVFPVLHCEDSKEHILRNVRIVSDHKIGGIFLISHNHVHQVLISQFNEVRARYPNLWLGINFLDLSLDNNKNKLEEAINACAGLNAVWIDQVVSSRLSIRPELEIFGGVAFKYINPNATIKQMETECELSLQNGVTTVTTSGDKTGHPPSTEKLVNLRSIVGTRARMGAASGTNDTNIGRMRFRVDDFLVATSICEKRNGYDEFVPQKLRKVLIKAQN